MKKSMVPARNASSIADAGGNAKVPVQKVSRFRGNKGNFGGVSNVLNQKFAPKQKVVLPAIRITQNKGGGGK